MVVNRYSKEIGVQIQLVSQKHKSQLGERWGSKKKGYVEADVFGRVCLDAVDAETKTNNNKTQLSY